MSLKGGWGLALAVALTLAGAPRALAQEAERPARGQAAAVEGELKRLADKVGPAVVGISAAGPRGRSNDGGRSTEGREGRRNEPSGAGIIVRPEGYVLTTGAVVPAGARRITVTLPGGMKLAAEEASRDDKLGLVALRLLGVPNGGVQAIYFAEDVPQIKRGKLVMTFGNPFGTITRDGQAAMSVGTLSGIDGTTLETDAAVNPGSFGGPLVDAGGNVIGIVVPEYRNERWLGLARLVDGDVRNFVNGLPVSSQGAPAPESGLVADEEETNRGLLGFYMYEDSDGPAKIEKVQPGGAADKAKLKAGDVILTFNGKKVPGAGDLAKRLKKVKAGETIAFRISRDVDGDQLEKDVKLTADARPEEAAPVRPWLGFFAVNHSGREGIGIDEVVAGSPAEKAGLKKGDVVRTVNGKKVNSTDELAKHLEGKKPGDELHFAIGRTIDGEEWEKKISLKLGSKKATPQASEGARAEKPEAPPVPAAKKGGGYLGVYLKDQPDGLVVENVIAGSPAEKSGLKNGDRIVGVGGDKIDSIESFTKSLQRYGAGDKIEIMVGRGEDWTKPVEVTLGQKPDKMPTPPTAPTPPTPPTPPTAPKPPAAPTAEAKPAYLGVKLEEVAGGLKIIEVLGGSPAEKSGLKVGQTITALDGSAVSSTEAFAKIIRSKKAGEKLAVTLADGKLDVTLGAKN